MRLIDADRLKAHYCWWSGGTKELTIDEAKKTFDTIVDVQPTVEQPQTNATENMAEIVRCKDCKYFLYDKIYMVEGLPLMGNLVCEKWGNGCRTDENGYCFMGERKEDGLLVIDKN